MAAVEEIELPVSQRPEWEGFAPLAAAGARSPVVAIKYDPHDAELLAFFYGAVRDEEVSLRVFHLAIEVIALNSADYTAWEWLWRCARLLGPADPEVAAQEQRVLAEVAGEGAKNYQLWNYRKRLALHLGPSCAHEELAVAHMCLMQDAKNYHVWAHRQAVVQLAGLWQLEHGYACEAIADDVYNNSAWNQRYFALRGMGLRDGALEQRLQEELTSVQEHISAAVHNPSSWSYLRGLWLLQPGSQALHTALVSLCEQIEEQHPLRQLRHPAESLRMWLQHQETTLATGVQE